MSLSGILLYCLRAGAFAAVSCGVYVCICLLRRRPVRLRTLTATAYIAALIQITVLRGGVDWQKVSCGVRDAALLVPFGTTVKLLGGGLWNLIYNVVGNLIWFVPLGILLGRRSPLRALLSGVLLSAGIELCQYILMTGCTDVDDVILNALGALLGWVVYRAWLRLRKKRT